MKKAYFRRIYNWFAGLLILFCLGNTISVCAQTTGSTTSDSQPFYKLAPGFISTQGKISTTNLRAQVKDQTQFIFWIQINIPKAKIINAGGPVNILNVFGLSAVDLSLILQNPEVIFVDVANRTPREERALNNADLTINQIEPVHQVYPDLHGAGLVVSVKENPFDTTDIDFKGRIVKNAAFNKSATTHAANMATLVAGAGNSAPSGKGVAWQANITASDFSQLLPDDTNQLKAAGITVQNHSYGVAIENYYGLETLAYDQQVMDYPELLHVFSSGNSGNQADKTGTYAGLMSWANLTGQFKMSKNTVSVGAINSDGKVGALSSRGPAYDGRVKPELVAYGENGTSEAAALVSGIGLLVQQAYKQQHNALPSAALVKAALINSADDTGRPEVDFETGFGNANALAATHTIKENRYFTGSVASGNNSVFRLVVPNGAKKFKATLVWHESPAAANAPLALVNDLDLTLINTLGQQWLPWTLSTFPHPDSLALPAKQRPDHINNVEQVTVADLPAGIYFIQVKGYQVSSGSQAFSVAYEIETNDLEWRNPTANSVLPAGSTARLRWYTSPGTDAFGFLQYRYMNAGSWQTINDNIAIGNNYFDWETPDTAAVAQFRLKYNNQTVESEPFIISRQLSLQLGFNCAETVMFHWQKQAGASGYQLYKLGANYLEPYQQTTDTLLIIHKANEKSTHFAVAPIIENKTGLKSVTVNYQVETVKCYVKSFLPRHFVSDSILFDAELSTLYGVVSVSLQKLVNGEYQTIQTLPAGKSLTKLLQDINPKPGRNDYRLQILTTSQVMYYSEPEYVIYAPPNFVQVYPNPVQGGTTLSVVTESDAKTLIYVYDSLGKLVTQFAEEGVVKDISTAGLKPGLYLIRTLTPAGKLNATRLIVY